MIRGIDVSEHNGNLDLEKIKRSGIQYMIIRSSYGMYYEDKQFRSTYQKCDAVHMPYGFYHYSYARNLSEAKIELDGMMKSIAGAKPTYPIYIDMEDADGWKANHGSPSNEMYQSICEYFCKGVEEAGYYAGIYANLDWLTNRLNSPRLDPFDKWVAQWANACTYTKAYGMWQYTSNGSVPGSSARTDMNYALKDYPAIIKPPIRIPEIALKIGDMVKPIRNISYDGVQLIKKVLDHYYPVIEIAYDRIVLGGGLNTAFRISDVLLRNGNQVATSQIGPGSRVRVREGAVDYHGIKLASFVYQQIYDLMELTGDRAVIGKDNVVTAAIRLDDLRVS